MEQHQGFLGTAIYPDLLPGPLMISAPAFVFWVTETNVLFIKLVIEHDNAIYWLSSGAKNSCEA